MSPTKKTLQPFTLYSLFHMFTHKRCPSFTSAQESCPSFSVFDNVDVVAMQVVWRVFLLLPVMSYFLKRWKVWLINWDKLNKIMLFLSVTLTSLMWRLYWLPSWILCKIRFLLKFVLMTLNLRIKFEVCYNQIFFFFWNYAMCNFFIKKVTRIFS